MTRRELIIIGAVLALFIAGFIGLTYKSATHSPPQKAATTADLPSADSVAKQQAAKEQKQIALATIHKGEGVESAFIRQLMNDPSAYGFKGDAIKTGVVKIWAQRKAHLTAIKAGYVDWKFGREIRVKYSDKAAYVLIPDERGGVRVVARGIGASSPQRVHILTASSSVSQFLGLSGQEHIQPYEYIYIGV